MYRPAGVCRHSESHSAKHHCLTSRYARGWQARLQQQRRAAQAAEQLEPRGGAVVQAVLDVLQRARRRPPPQRRQHRLRAARTGHLRVGQSIGGAFLLLNVDAFDPAGSKRLGGYSTAPNHHLPRHKAVIPNGICSCKWLLGASPHKGSVALSPGRPLRVGARHLQHVQRCGCHGRCVIAAPPHHGLSPPLSAKRLCVILRRLLKLQQSMLNIYCIILGFT